MRGFGNDKSRSSLRGKGRNKLYYHGRSCNNGSFNNFDHHHCNSMIPLRRKTLSHFINYGIHYKGGHHQNIHPTSREGCVGAGIVAFSVRQQRSDQYDSEENNDYKNKSSSSTIQEIYLIRNNKNRTLYPPFAYKDKNKGPMGLGYVYPQRRFDCHSGWHF